jgi:hypothetical protein
VKIIDFFAGSAAALVAHVLAGHVILVYEHWDISHTARKYAAHVLECLHRDFPAQVSREIVEKAFDNPGDIRLFTGAHCRHDYTHCHAGWCCQDLSAANRTGKGLKGPQSKI